MIDTIVHGDCLQVMKDIPDKSIDMIFCDLPYGTTACKWDVIIPFEPLWEQYKRIIKDNGAIVLTASQPFTSALVMSNIKMFKYCWYWEKERLTNPMTVKKMVGKTIEECVVFYKNQPTYNSQKTIHIGKLVKNSPKGNHGVTTSDKVRVTPYNDDGTRHATQLLKFRRDYNFLHPTQKPVALFEYLIKTYTNEGDTVLDNCAGSGTTVIACIATKRNCIAYELDADYYRDATKRIKDFESQIKLF